MPVHPVRRFAWIAAAIMLAGAAPAPAAERVKISGHPNWPPFSWQSGEQIVGIGTDLAALVFKDIGFEVESVLSGNWKRAQAQAEHGAVDVLVAAYRTNERKQYLLYPETPIMEDVNVIWVRKGGEFSFKKWDDLIGRKGSAMLGESYGQAFDTFIKDKLTIDRVSTPAQTLQMLALGRVDYYPFSLYGGKIQVKQFGFSARLTHLPQPLSSENIYLAISRKSPFAKYLPQIEAAIAARRADGSIERLIRKHTP